MAETNKSTTKGKAAKTKEETHNEQRARAELLNRDLEDSFPASDPPSIDTADQRNGRAGS